MQFIQGLGSLVWSRVCWLHTGAIAAAALVRDDPASLC